MQIRSCVVSVAGTFVATSWDTAICRPSVANWKTCRPRHWGGGLARRAMRAGHPTTPKPALVMPFVSDLSACVSRVGYSAELRKAGPRSEGLNMNANRNIGGRSLRGGTSPSTSDDAYLGDQLGHRKRFEEAAHVVCALLLAQVAAGGHGDGHAVQRDPPYPVPGRGGSGRHRRHVGRVLTQPQYRRPTVVVTGEVTGGPAQRPVGRRHQHPGQYFAGGVTGVVGYQPRQEDEPRSLHRIASLPRGLRLGGAGVPTGGHTCTLHVRAVNISLFPWVRRQVRPNGSWDIRPFAGPVPRTGDHR